MWILESREKCDRRVKSVHSMPCFLSRCDVDFYARVCEDIQLALHHRSHVYHRGMEWKEGEGSERN